MRPAPSSITSYQSPPTCVPSTPGCVVRRDLELVGDERRRREQAALELVGDLALARRGLALGGGRGERLLGGALLGDVLVGAAQAHRLPVVVVLDLAERAEQRGRASWASRTS